MARPHTAPTEGFGSDSFLDIVCNMVGIIILLVLVVGLRVKNTSISLTADAAAAETTTPQAQPPADLQSLEQQLKGAQLALTGVEQNQEALEQHLLATRQAARAKEEETRQLNAQLAQTQQWQTELQNALLAKQQQLRSLAMAVQSVQGARPAKTVQVEAYPAPVSRTVEGSEAHFQVLGDRVVHVPFAALVNKFKADARAKVQASPSSAQIEAVVGPIENFNLRYVLTQAGPGRFGLERFSFIPLSSRMGETAAEALAPSSRFRQVLASYDPNRTTITFWTYQDSFDAFRQLRKEVYLLGYSVASRPMPIGQLISGSPDGSKSAAQ
jgi:hypothetical protein